MRVAARARFILVLLPSVAFAIGAWMVLSQAMGELTGTQERQLRVLAGLFAGAIDTGAVERLFDHAADTQRDLYAAQWHGDELVLDGRRDEWPDAPTVQYGQADLVELRDTYKPETLGFTLASAVTDDRFLLFVAVTDDRVVYRQFPGRSVTRNDHLRLDVGADVSERAGAGARAVGGAVHRLVIAPHQPGPVVVHEVTELGRALRESIAVRGEWLATAEGYNLELSAPRAWLGGAIALSVWDVDDAESRSLRFVMGHDAESAPGSISARSGDIDRQLAAFVARSGDVDAAELQDPWGRRLGFAGVEPHAMKPPAQQVSVAAGTGDKLRLHVSGSGELHVIQTLLRNGWILAGVTSFLVALVVWFIIAGWVKGRLSALTGLWRQAIDAQGRVLTTDGYESGGESGLRDEFSDLATEVGDGLARTRQYLGYLEGAASQLTHEMRTPISVVRSSLESVDVANLQPEDATYLNRALAGVGRLMTLLNKLTEARRLEEALHPDEMEVFDLADVVRGSVEGYASIYRDVQIELNLDVDSVKVVGVPDLFAQLLDKLMSNAVDFSPAGEVIRVRLGADTNFGVLRVVNAGQNPPEGRLFDSMVSLRSGVGDGEHLGLGLYICRVIADFHSADIDIKAREDVQGAVVTVRIPVAPLLAGVPRR